MLCNAALNWFVAAGDGVFEGIRKSEVVNAYLEQISNQIESEEELLEKKSLIERIIDRLIYHVRMKRNIVSGWLEKF